jgi:hypothetical protein
LPQYHVTYDDSFETVQFMRDCVKPPTWEEMCKNSRELATDEQLDLAKIWVSNKSNKTPDHINDPFQVVSDQFEQGRVVSPSEGAFVIPQLSKIKGEFQEASNVQGNTLNQSMNATEKRVHFGASERIGADTRVSAAVPLSSPGAQDLPDASDDLSC